MRYSLGGRHSLLCFVISTLHSKITRNRRMRSPPGEHLILFHIPPINPSGTKHCPNVPITHQADTFLIDFVPDKALQMPSGYIFAL